MVYDSASSSSTSSTPSAPCTPPSRTTVSSPYPDMGQWLEHHSRQSPQLQHLSPITQAYQPHSEHCNCSHTHTPKEEDYARCPRTPEGAINVAFDMAKSLS